MAEFLKEACFGLDRVIVIGRGSQWNNWQLCDIVTFLALTVLQETLHVCTSQDVVELAPYLEQNFGKLFSSKIVSCANILRLLYKSECQTEPVAISSCVYWRWDL